MKFKEETAFPITYWYGPPVEFQTEETYRQVKEAGFTLIGPPGTDTPTVEENQQLLRICEKVGLKACIQDARMRDCVLAKDGWEDQLEALVADYKDYPALYSYYVTDEPSASLFPQLARIASGIDALDPKHPAYINLYPNYAPAKALGNDTYYEHVAEYIRVVKPAFVSYDHYHFIKAAAADQEKADAIASTGDEREDMIRQAALRNVDRKGFFDNIEEVRELCLKADLPFMVIVLLIEHGCYRNVTEAELRYEVFQSLAYGASCLSYFTYWTVIGADDEFWHWQNGMIDKDGTVLPHYYDVQKINRDLAAAGKRLLPLTSLSVSHVGEESERVTPWSANEDILSIESQRLTVGRFTEGYYLLANKEFIVENNVSLRIAPGRRVWRLDCAADEERELTPEEGNLNVTLAPGDMALLRIEAV